MTTPTPAHILDEKPPYGVAGLLSLAVLTLYVVTLAPTTQFWDTSEYLAAAKVLGIPHPPGNPLFVLVAHVWADLPLAASYAKRINLFAAVTSALSAGLWFLVGERWLRHAIAERWPRRIAALAGALVGATAFTVWNQSVVNEKVYTLSLFSIALILWLAVRWADQPAGLGRDQRLLVILYLLALTATNHLMGLLVGPAVIVLAFVTLQQDPHTGVGAPWSEWTKFFVFCAAWAMLIFIGLENPKIFILGAILLLTAIGMAAAAGSGRFAVLALLVCALGVSVWLFLPIRAAHFPPINEGEPTNWQAFLDVLLRRQYGKPPLMERQATFAAQIGMWIQYFSWQWAHGWGPRLQSALAVIFFFLGVGGAVHHWKTDKRSAAAMTALVGTLTLVLLFYLNFKYGFSQYPERPGLLREVRERDYFFMASFAIWGIWVGMGLALLMRWIVEGFGDRSTPVGRWAFASIALIPAFVPLASNGRIASRAGETIARDFAYDMLQSVKPYGILVTAGDNDTFPLWYAQEVEGIRQDVTVVNLSLANTEWHLRQLTRRPLATFNPDSAPAIYRGRQWPKPTTPLVSWTFEQMDRIPGCYPLAQPTGFAVRTLHVTLEPENFVCGGTIERAMERADLIVLQAIKDNLGTRPIYFARTIGNYAQRFGFLPYLVTQGLAQELNPAPVVASDSIVMLPQLPQLGYIDVPTTLALAREVYHGESAARPRPYGWIDEPSQSILVVYQYTYAITAELARSRDTTLARKGAEIIAGLQCSLSPAQCPR